jgi:hypothetical protein
VQSIQRGQAAASSLANAGGKSPDTQLTARALADMSDAEFARLYDELVAKGDKSKLMDIFRALTCRDWGRGKQTVHCRLGKGFLRSIGFNAMQSAENGHVWRLQAATTRKRLPS